MSGMSLSDLRTFKDNKLITEIFPQIYLHKDFLPQSLNKKYVMEMELRKDEWNNHGNYSVGDHNEFGDLYNWTDKLSFDFNFDGLKYKIINTVSPPYWIFNHSNFVRLRAGDSAPLTRSYEDMDAMYSKPLYKLAYYVGEWTGGELFFPALNFEYKPEEGDLLIFSADKEYVHLTKEVTSGTRYCYIDMLNYHPGYFIG
jgi:hypothetical protein